MRAKHANAQQQAVGEAHIGMRPFKRVCVCVLCMFGTVAKRASQRYSIVFI